MDALETLHKMPGWQYLVEQAEERWKANRKALTVAKVQSVEEMAQYNHIQGFMEGIQWVAQLPSLVLEEAKEVYKAELEAERQQNDD